MALALAVVLSNYHDESALLQDAVFTVGACVDAGVFASACAPVRLSTCASVSVNGSL